MTPQMDAARKKSDEDSAVAVQGGPAMISAMSRDDSAGCPAPATTLDKGVDGAADALVFAAVAHHAAPQALAGLRQRDSELLSTLVCLLQNAQT